MFPKKFEYRRASSLEEALEQLAQLGPDAKLLAGGHSLIPAMKLRLAAPAVLVDIGRIPDFKGIQRSDGQIAILAGSSHWMVESSQELKASIPLLPEVASVIGDMQVRNLGTVGGNLAHADPASDLPAAVLALDAKLKIASKRGERIIAASDFFQGMFTTALEPDEALVEISVPSFGPRTGSAYLKFAHPASGYAVVGVAAVLQSDDAGNCRTVRVAVTGAGTKPARAVAVETALVGQRLDEKLIEDASSAAADGLDLLGDIYASAEYRANLAKVLTKRALMKAWQRAQ
jgi:carbon-monoxide dehydrogenase medium subunit